MKSIIFSFLAFMLFSNPQRPTVDTYDWSSYHKKSQELNEGITAVIRANVLLFDSKAVDFDKLPKRTKVQLAILQDAEYEEWKTAEKVLGRAEAAKYWLKMKNMEPMGLSCFDSFNVANLELSPSIHENIESCQLETRTACHIIELKKVMDLAISFYECMDNKYHDSDKSIFKKDPIFTTY